MSEHRTSGKAHTTTTTTKRFEGFDARFGMDSDELYVEVRVGSPAYIRLHEGKYLQEGDAFHRDQLGMDSPTLDTWEVTGVTDGTVVGRHLTHGEEVTWDREEVETGLAIGGYSTNLSDFERVEVYQVGHWEDYDPEGTDAGTHYTGLPYVSAIAYGDNGMKYGRRYRFVDPEATEVFLWKQDLPRSGFSPAVMTRLNERVAAALAAEGYSVAAAVAADA